MFHTYVWECTSRHEHKRSLQRRTMALRYRGFFVTLNPSKCKADILSDNAVVNSFFVKRNDALCGHTRIHCCGAHKNATVPYSA